MIFSFFVTLTMKICGFQLEIVNCVGAGWKRVNVRTKNRETGN